MTSTRAIGSHCTTSSRGRWHMHTAGGVRGAVRHPPTPCGGMGPCSTRHKERGMRIALDARTLTGTDSGIGSYTRHLVRALLEEDRDLELLLIRNPPRGPRQGQDPRVQEV